MLVNLDLSGVVVVSLEARVESQTIREESLRALSRPTASWREREGEEVRGKEGGRKREGERGRKGEGGREREEGRGRKGEGGRERVRG